MNNLSTLLKEQYSNLGLSKETIESVANMLFVEGMGEEELKATVARAEPLMKHIQSESDKLRGAKKAAEKRVEELEKQANDVGQEQEDKVAKLLETLEKRMNTLENERIKTSRSKEMEEALASLPDSIKKAYSHVDVATMDEDQFRDFTKKVKEEGEAISSELKSIGKITPPRSHAAREHVNDDEAKKMVEDALKGVKI